MGFQTGFIQRRVEDAVRLCQKHDACRFLGFLDSAEIIEAKRTVEKYKVKHRFFAGYPDGERMVLGVFPDWCEPEDSLFPISPITAVFRKGEMLSHRDFLGALMSLGIERETVGDILPGDGFAVFFVLKDISPFILTQLDMVGKTGVKLSEGLPMGLPLGQGFLEISKSIASERLDCVVAALCNTGRSKAAELIKTGLVSVNSLPAEKLTKQVSSGDKISIRGKGKYLIQSVDDRSKRGRIILKARKYL
ncbi:MAG TPA: hypothetical protein GXX17_07785 [Clostridiales bacterium]|nr:hypothetical protein [Clostridiales bacterium]